MNPATMVLDIFVPLSEVTGLPPIVLICALATILFLIIFGVLILVKVRNLIKVLNKVNYSLDGILLRIEKRSGKFENKKNLGNSGGSTEKTDGKFKDTGHPRHNSLKFAADISERNEVGNNLRARSTRNHKQVEAQSPGGGLGKEKSEEYKTNQEVSAKICELLKKSGKPTPYHELTKLLSKDYPGYDYDFFLKEVEGLQKEGKVKAQLVAGKLYFQIKEP